MSLYWDAYHHFVECHSAKGHTSLYHYAEAYTTLCHYSERHNGNFYYSECYYNDLFIITTSLYSVEMLTVTILSVKCHSVKCCLSKMLWRHVDKFKKRPFLLLHSYSLLSKENKRERNIKNMKIKYFITILK